MKCRDDAARGEVRPDPHAGAVVRVLGEEVRRVLREGLLEELADDGRFEERFVVVAERGDQAAGVEGEEGGGFVVGVDFFVAVGDALFFEHGPGALDEGAAGRAGKRVVIDR